MLHKSMDWFLYDNGLHHERVKYPYSVQMRENTGQKNFKCGHYFRSVGW